MHMSRDCRQSPLKTLLNTFGTYHKTHGMVTRYGNQDTEDFHDTKDPTPFDLATQDHPLPEGDNDLSNEYCEETDTCHHLAVLLEQYQQLKNQFTSLKSNTPQSTPTEELPQLRDKIQHLTMALQPAPHSPVRSQCIRPWRHTQTPCAQPRGIQISPQPSSKISPHLMGKTLQSWKIVSWI